MNSSTIIEAVGYIGSALVLVSFLMTSVVKLRVVNSIGSIIFTVYAFIIHSYPTAIMNLCLVIINIYYLIKLCNPNIDYTFVKISPEDSLVKHVINYNSDDIKKCFPGISLDFSSANAGYAICHKGSPVGILIGKLENDAFEILLDYSTAEYRDFSVGRFLMSKLPAEGIKTLVYRGADVNHKAYLSKVGFVQKAGYYEKTF